jgi:hypothetical protein
MEKFTSSNTGIDPFVRNNNDATSARFGHLNAIVDNLNNNINSGDFTLIPDVILGTGSVGEFDFDYIKVNNKVLLTFFCNEFIIPIGEVQTIIQLDLTGTPAEPTENFNTNKSVPGSINVNLYNNDNGGNVFSAILLYRVQETKKIQIEAATISNVVNDDFNTFVRGSITITI